MSETLKQVNLEKMQFAFIQEFSKYLFDLELKEDLWRGFAEDRFMVSLRGYVWGESMGIYSIQYPRDWWEAFKDRWFPFWLRRKLPIRYTIIRLDARLIYPNFRPALSNEMSIVTFTESREVNRGKDT